MTGLRTRRWGFTLLELLVVIAIMAVLLAIIVPVGKRLRESNQTSRCEAQLAHVGQALKMYFLDEQGVPLMGENADVVNYDYFPGLEALHTLGYLKSRAPLHCPRHEKDSAGAVISRESDEYYRSYMIRDPKAKTTGTQLRQYKYMPYRYALEADYPTDYLRQLTRTTKSVDIGGTTYSVSGYRSAMPPDDTIVTWCNYHADFYKLNKHGQYVVLYWDGSVKLLDQELFTDSAVDPLEAWLVKPTDIAH